MINDHIIHYILTPIIQGSLNEFSKFLKYLASSSIHTIARRLDLLFTALRQERKRRNEQFSYKVPIDTLRCNRSFLIYRDWVCEIFTKTRRITSLSINVYRPYVCDPLGLYISLVNNFIDPIILISQPY